jgi:hypothetical protein
VISYVGFFFYETQYHAYKLAIVQEWLDTRHNLEFLLKKRMTMKSHWAEQEVEKVMTDLIAAMASMQN